MGEQTNSSVLFTEAHVHSLQHKLDAFGATLTTEEAAAFAAFIDNYVDPEVRGYIAPARRLRHVSERQMDDFTSTDSRGASLSLHMPAGRVLHARVRR